MRRVGIVTDSTADIPPDLVERLKISVVPCYVVFGRDSYLDIVELSRSKFYEKLSTAPVIPSTAAPPPAFYEEAYRQLLQETDEIVSIHLARNLSGIHGSAVTAAKNIPGARIAVLDSEQVTMGYGWMVVSAAEAAARGASLEEVVHLVEGMKGRSNVLAILDTLEYVYRGGRVNWVQAMVGALLRVKPIVQVRCGEVLLLERSRTWQRSIDALLSMIQALGSLERLIVLHTNAPDYAEQLASRLEAAVPRWERLVGWAGVTIASHAGPGAVGIACVSAG